MSFPLSDWIDAHANVPHHLAQSGMAGSLRTVPRALRERPDPDAARLRRAIARLHSVEPPRVFLTHGASEGNAMTLLYLVRRLVEEIGRTPRLFAPTPEYPPLPDTARAVGFRRVASPRTADVIALSTPRNPEGTRVAPGELAAWSGPSRAVLVDQTFREFRGDPPWTASDLENLWLTGSFTKVYGADDLRVGFVIAPETSAAGFGAMHGLFLDRLPSQSVSGALAILAHRSEILAEVRALFHRNVRTLRRAIEGVERLAAPVWFDRGRGPLDTERFTRALLRSGVLVCPGRFFGDPTGVRICLTRRSFPDDLEAYIEVRERFG